MASLWDNFELGAAGLFDIPGQVTAAGLEAVGLDSAAQWVEGHSNWAAETYAAQTPGADLDAAQTAEDTSGFFTEAAKRTANDIFNGVAGFLGGTANKLEWGVGIAAGALVLVAAFKVHEVLK